MVSEKGGAFSAMETSIYGPPSKCSVSRILGRVRVRGKLWTTEPSVVNPSPEKQVMVTLSLALEPPRHRPHVGEAIEFRAGLS